MLLYILKPFLVGFNASFIETGSSGDTELQIAHWSFNVKAEASIHGNTQRRNRKKPAGGSKLGEWQALNQANTDL